MNDDEKRQVFRCKTCGEFVWGDERAAHMLREHHEFLTADAFEAGAEVPPVVIP